MPVRDEVGAQELPDQLEEDAAIEPGQLGDLRLPVEAHPVPVGDGDEEEVERRGVRGEALEVALPHQAAVDPGEADPPASGKPPDPLRADRTMSLPHAPLCTRSR